MSKTDALTRVARDRAHSVVVLHSIRRSAPTAQGHNWYVQSVIEAFGTGVVIDDDGLILTAASVLEPTGRIHVRRPDGTDIDVQLVGADSKADLALVRVSDATGLSAAPFGDSARIGIGEIVVAAGRCFSLQPTMTAGIVRAKRRSWDGSIVEFLETDAGLSLGMGGPLFDTSGHIVGVVNGSVSAGPGVFLNSAVAIDVVKSLIPALRAGDRPPRRSELNRSSRQTDQD